MKKLIGFLLLLVSASVFAEDCQGLKWKRNRIDFHEVQYYGSVTPGTAKTIFVEVWDDKGMLGTGFNIVNPRGKFSVFAESSKKLKMKKSSRPIFSCTMDNYLNESK
jgi:hypothetical protein